MQSSISSSVAGPGLIKIPGTASANNQGFTSNAQSTVGSSTGFGQTNFGQQQFGQTGFGQTGSDFVTKRPANDVRPPYTSQQQTNVYNQNQGQIYESRPGSSIAKPGIPYLPPDEPSTRPPAPTPSTPRTTSYRPPPTKPSTPYQPPPTPYRPSTARPTSYQPTTARPTTYQPPTTRPTLKVPIVGQPYLPPKEDESPQPSSGSQQIVPGPQDSEGSILLDNTRTVRPPGEAHCTFNPPYFALAFTPM